MTNDPRTMEELRSHYELEVRLAKQLREAPREERLKLYPVLYDELYRSIPFLKTNPATIDGTRLKASLRLLSRFLGQDRVFLEIGAGNLALSRVISPFVKQVFALDVSQEFATALGPMPKNVHFILSDGISISVEPNSVDIAYSNQLMEHLHPEDAFEQLQNILLTLKPGGRYICNTPHRFNGPHDITGLFDQEARGFHLKEYTNEDLCRLMCQAGFRRVYSLTGARGYAVPFPVWSLVLLERLLASLPKWMRRSMSRFLPMKLLLGIRLVGVK